MPSNSTSSVSSLAISAGKLPPGLSSQERDSFYNGVPMTAVLGFFASIAFTCYCIRMYTRIVIVRKVGWNDLLCNLGMIGALINIICFGIASIDGPLGKHMWNITLADFLDKNFVIFYFMTPRPGETMAKHFGGNLAARVTRLSIPTTSVGLAIDVLLLVIPLTAVIPLNMTKTNKIRLLLTFIVGIMAIYGSILSLVFKIKTYGNRDLTYHLILVNFFICTEMIFGICIACIPLLPRALSHFQPKLDSLAGNLSSPFLYFGKMVTGRTTADQTPKISSIYDVERESESESRLVELHKLDKHVPLRLEAIIVTEVKSVAMRDFYVFKWFWILVLLTICFPALADSEKTFSLSFSPGNDSIIPFTAAFNNAFLKTNVSFDAGKKSPAGIEIAALNETFPFSTSNWVGIAIDDFELNFDIAFGLLSSGATANNLSYPLVSFPLTTVTIDELEVGVSLNLNLFAKIHSELDTKFSTGFNIKMINAAGMILQYTAFTLGHTPGLFTSGLDGNNFEITPLFNTSDPSPEFAFELAVRTELVLKIGSATFLQLNLDLPAYTINATQRQRVNYECDPATWTPAGQTFSNLTYVTGDITTSASWQLGKLGGGFDNAQPIFGPIDLVNVTSQCLAYSPVLATQVKAPKYVSDLNSITSPIAQPTKHISNGGAVGITFAVEILVIVLVAGIFWFWKSRRASRRDDMSDRHFGMKRGAILGLLAGVGLAIAGFFKRKHREREKSSGSYAAPTYLPRSTTERSTGYKEWDTKAPILTTFPVNDFSEAIRFAPIAPLADFDPVVSAEIDVARPHRRDELVQARAVQEEDAVSAVSALSAQPPQQSRTNPTNKVHDEIPWEEPRSNLTSSPPPRHLFRKVLPGRKSY